MIILKMSQSSIVIAMGHKLGQNRQPFMNADRLVAIFAICIKSFISIPNYPCGDSMLSAV